MGGRLALRSRGLLLLEAMKVMCFPAMRALLQHLPLLPDDHANLRGPGYYH